MLLNRDPFFRLSFRLYAGHDSAIDVFGFSQPGEGTRLKLSPSRKSKDGQKGQYSLADDPRIQFN